MSSALQINLSSVAGLHYLIIVRHLRLLVLPARSVINVAHYADAIYPDQAANACKLSKLHAGTCHHLLAAAVVWCYPDVDLRLRYELL